MTHFTLEKDLGYIDATEEWTNIKAEKGIVLDSYYYITNNHIYIVDGSKKVQLNYSKKELEVAYWLVNTFGGKLYMKPRVNYPFGIKTADYFWKGEYWDLKVFKNVTSKTRAVDNIIKSQKNQAHNFIIDITNCNVSTKCIIEQVRQLFNIKKEKRNWINKIIIKNDNNLISIFIKK